MGFGPNNDDISGLSNTLADIYINTNIRPHKN